MVPDWLRSIRGRLDANVPAWFAEHPVPPDPLRSSAVLVLFWADDAGDTRVVLTERAHHLRSHAAQVVFPGGHVDPGETPAQAAVRESTEEIGVDPRTVEIIDLLPGVYMTPNRTAFIPVLGWWHEPHAVGVVDPEEVRRVVLPTVAELANPINRFTATAPGGFRGPGFFVDDLIVWGVTANLLESVLELGGHSRPWDATIRHALPYRLLAAYARDI
ncbi:NUDIX hydrolase [Granulicoccus sp. GXG6511]|uniref:NUDIX hydrolase n=1 Tax=Granulicoccus sp. GXG6511 TaxID=3381351 RepID=UPI003D7D83F8